ncbi:MAG: mechanosensitive ion channel [Myxococcales bacterium]|nr:mechanosensitive ion channel [Myxococcales bacterium]
MGPDCGTALAVPELHALVERWLQRADVDAAYRSGASRVLVLVGVVVLAVVANWGAKRIILRVVKHFIQRTEAKWDDVIMENHVFDRLSHLAPAMVLYSGSFVAFPDWPGLQNGTRNACIAYMVIVVAVVADGMLNAVGQIYNGLPVARTRPIKSYLQVVKVAVFLVTAIIVVSTLTDRSPWGFLSGLAGLTAVIMLVFKDSILGLVASIQLTANHMVHVGDWIEMPSRGADGDVLDISLNTVKVQNWDKTISTIPTYALISESFKNWRGMQESGGRRIKRALYLDMNSVRFLRPEDLEHLKRIEILRDYLDRKLEEIGTGDGDEAVRVNRRRLTNLGTFRAYVEAYLQAHPKIHKGMTFLVRQLPPGAKGLGLEIYVFSADQVWANYEALQADIFDHLLAALSEFDLRVYQQPGGADVRALSASAPSAR